MTISGANLWCRSPGTNLLVPISGANLLLPISGADLLVPISGAVLLVPISGANLWCRPPGSNLLTTCLLLDHCSLTHWSSSPSPRPDLPPPTLVPISPSRQNNYPGFQVTPHPPPSPSVVNKFYGNRGLTCYPEIINQHLGNNALQCGI